MTDAAHIALGLAGLWLVLALLIPRLPVRHRDLANRITVVLGVPVLGLLTLYCGPRIGVTGFALGVALLLWHPLRRRRPRPADSDVTTLAE